jgi:thiol-disulfide isomerase/thioredoxin
MKTLATIIIMSFLTVSCSMAQKNAFSDESLSETLVNIDGSKTAFKEILEKHKGKTVVIEFWASWCGDCVKAMPKIKSLQSNFSEVDFVFISLDKSFEKFKLGVEKHELKGSHYWIDDADGMKGKFGRSVDLDWIPRYIIIDKEGKIVTYRAIETDFEKMNTTLKTLK